MSSPHDAFECCCSPRAINHQRSVVEPHWAKGDVHTSDATSTRKCAPRHQLPPLVGDTYAPYQTASDTLRFEGTHTPSRVLISAALIHATVPTLALSQHQASQATCIAIKRDNSSAIDHQKGIPPCSTSCLALIPLVMGLEFQRSSTTRAATPWARIKGALLARHAFHAHYADWFRPAMDSLGEQLQLPTSLCRRWPNSSSSSSPRLAISSPNLTKLTYLNSEEASNITYTPFPWSNSYYIQLKPVNIIILISTLTAVTYTKQIVCDARVSFLVRNNKFIALNW